MSALAARRIEVDTDVRRMSADALAEGWGDGLPLIPPTEDLVAEFVAHSGRDASHSLGRIPPSRARCTVEKVAINAVMAGAPAESMGLICTSLEAMIDSPLWLDGINATTAAVVPAVIVNGPIRDELEIPYQLLGVRRHGVDGARDRSRDPSGHAQHRRTGRGTHERVDLRPARDASPGSSPASGRRTPRGRRWRSVGASPATR